MPGGKYKAIPVEPAGVCGIMLHDPGPKHIAGGGKPHGGTGVPGVGLLDGIHGKGANSIDTELIDCCLAFSNVFIHNMFLLFWGFVEVKITGRLDTPVLIYMQP